MADKNMEAQISVEFEEATSRQSLNSGETINTLWGKVKRWLSDLKAVAFSGSYNDLSEVPDLSAYAKKTDIPTELPANGGNADKISNVTIDDIFHSVGLNAISDIDNTSGNWSVGIVTDWEVVLGTFPDNCPSWVIINQYRTSGDHFVMQTCTSIETNPKMWVRGKHVTSESWGSWQRVNDGGNADTVDGVHIGCVNDAPPGCWFAAYTDGNNLRAIEPSKAWVGTATNADTLDGLHSDSFALKTDLDSVFKHYGLKGVADISPDTRGCFTVNIIDSFTGWLNVIQFEDGHFITQIGTYANAGITTGGWIRTRYANNPFGDWNTGWVRLCQAKSAAFSGTTSSNGLLALWDTNTFRRVPMYIEANNYRATPLLVNGVCYAQFIDPNTNSIVSNTQVSCTAFWTDL